jgi:hypothetical protein
LNLSDRSNILKGNNNPEEVLKQIKKSARWSQLDDFKLKCGLKVIFIKCS